MTTKRKLRIVYQCGMCGAPVGLKVGESVVYMHATCLSCRATIKDAEGYRQDDEYNEAYRAGFAAGQLALLEEHREQ